MMDGGSKDAVTPSPDAVTPNPDAVTPDPNEVLIVSPAYQDEMTPLKAFYDAAGHPATLVNALPPQLSNYRLLVINNPDTWLGSDATAPIKAHLMQGRRLLIFGDHCKFGCFVNEPRMNQLLQDLGLHATYSGTAGVTTETNNVVLPNRLTTGVTSVSFKYSGGMLNLMSPATALVKAANGDVLIMTERPTYVTFARFGDAVVIADMDTARMIASEPSNQVLFTNVFNIP